MQVFDIAIIGAGIVGAACAHRLAVEGHSVAVIDSGGIGAGSTSEGMGHIVVMDDSEAQFALTKLSNKLWNDLYSDLPKSSEYEFCGTIWLAADEDEMLGVSRKRDFYMSRGVRAEILDEKSLQEAEPNLRRGLLGGLFVRNDSVVYQPSATEFLLKKSNAKLFLHQKAVEIIEDGVKLEDSTLVRAGKVIVASGIWTGDLFRDFKIRKKKGHLVITDRYPDFIRHQLIELGYLKSAHASESDSVAFNVQPRITEQVLIGSSRQLDSEDKAIDYNILRKMMKRACSFMPRLKKLSAVRIWTGFRPATPDNLPYIGQHPTLKNVYLAVGHEGLGITTSLGTAEILADEIAGRRSQIDRRPYSPNRV